MGEKIHIYDVVQVLGLQPRPGMSVTPGMREGKFLCEICKRRSDKPARYTLNVNFEKDVFVCWKCHSGGGAVPLYSLVKFNETYHGGTKRGYEILESLKKELGIDDGKKTLPRMQQQQFLPAAAEPASDDRRDRVYRAIMAMPELALSPEHREHLLKRGLRPEHMGRYRTIPAKYVYFRLSPEVDAAIKQAPVKTPATGNRGFRRSTGIFQDCRTVVLFRYTRYSDPDAEPKGAGRMFPGAKTARLPSIHDAE